ncbi:unnamed protein product [Blepharisma stoltei]|uniref:Uncharacterized protein n=1 Tax=Blepharisma stoltei TaxID=1481888 RepID=A0AAU9J659_9CILI|nr:unnamed protein product [Blepharisma stoltei]
MNLPILNEKAFEAYKKIMPSSSIRQSSPIKTIHPNRHFSQDSLRKQSTSKIELRREMSPIKSKNSKQRSSSYVSLKSLSKPILGKTNIERNSWLETNPEPIKRLSPKYNSTQLYEPIGKLWKSKGIDIESSDAAHKMLENLKKKLILNKHHQIRKSSVNVLASVYKVSPEKLIKHKQL